MAEKVIGAQIDAFVLATEKRMVACVRQSVQNTADIAQWPRAKGGRMPVDTGFLRASGQMSLNGLPSGPVRGEKTEPNSYKTPDQTSIVALSQFELGNSIFFGWSANYARKQNLRTGFFDMAVKDWPNIVARVCAEIRRRSPGGR